MCYLHQTKDFELEWREHLLNKPKGLSVCPLYQEGQRKGWEGGIQDTAHGSDEATQYLSLLISKTTLVKLNYLSGDVGLSVYKQLKGVWLNI